MEADSRMEWTGGQTKQLIAAFKQRELLWNPSHSGYRDRQKKNKAWQDMANDMGQPEDHCRRKMESLLASFRRERSKLGKSIEEGNPSEMNYTPKWKFYPLMLFMLKATASDEADASVGAENLESLNTSPSDDDAVLPSAPRRVHRRAGLRSRKRQADEQPTTSSAKTGRRSRGAEESPSSLWYDNVSVGPPFEDQQHQLLSQEDSYDIFGKYVASELRGLDEKVLATVKHQISTAIFEAKMNMHGSSNVVVISDDIGL